MFRLGQRAAVAGAAAVFSQNRSLYSPKVMDHYSKPRNVGKFDKNDENVGTGLRGEPACGDMAQIQIKVDDDERIVDTRFKTFGCGSAIASSSYVSEILRGKKLSEALEITNKDIAQELSLPPVKLHCSMLAEETILAAVENYLSKKPSLKKKVKGRKIVKTGEEGAGAAAATSSCSN